MNYGSQKFGIWSSWIFCVLTVVGWLGIAHFILPAPADLSLDETKMWFIQEHRMGVLVGCTLFYIACGFLVPSSLQFGIMFAKHEGKWPLWAMTTAVNGLFISLIIFFNACAWIVCAYRPEFGADVIQAMSDWAWMGFLLGWFYLALEMFSSAMSELCDKREQPMVPRWFTWATFAGCLLLVGAAGPAFFQSGPFAYHGLLGFYVPMAVWGIYLVGTSWYMLKDLEREKASGEEL